MTSLEGYLISLFVGEGDNVTVQSASVFGSLSFGTNIQKGIGLLFGRLKRKCTVAGVVVGVSAPGGVNVQLVFQQEPDLELVQSGILIDCALDGVDKAQPECSEVIKTEAALAGLADFSWSASHNDQYPFISVLPVHDKGKYVLPADGPFSSGAYFVDQRGLPFPVSGYQICVGACYGVYSSPASLLCAEGATDRFCVNASRAAADFPARSCIADNSVCLEGASMCKSEFELDRTGGWPVCRPGCPGCVNGFCSGGECRCDIYTEGEGCAQYNCSADEPVCFAEPSQICTLDQQRCIRNVSCDDVECAHGACEQTPSAECICDGYWTGTLCDACGGFGEDCQVHPDECRRDRCGGHGSCSGAYQAPSCLCDGNWAGDGCGDCPGFGEDCELSAADCAAACCAGEPDCRQQCSGAPGEYACACVPGYVMRSGACKEDNSTMIAVVASVCAVVAAAAIAAAAFFLCRRGRKGPAKDRADGAGKKGMQLQDVTA